MRQRYVVDSQVLMMTDLHFEHYVLNSISDIVIIFVLSTVSAAWEDESGNGIFAAAYYNPTAIHKTTATSAWNPICMQSCKDRKKKRFSCCLLTVHRDSFCHRPCPTTTLTKKSPLY